MMLGSMWAEDKAGEREVGGGEESSPLRALSLLTHFVLENQAI